MSYISKSQDINLLICEHGICVHVCTCVYTHMWEPEEGVEYPVLSFSTLFLETVSPTEPAAWLQPVTSSNPPVSVVNTFRAIGIHSHIWLLKGMLEPKFRPYNKLCYP